MGEPLWRLTDATPDGADAVYHFVANLKDYTFHRGRGNRRFDSYLLSTDHADQARHLLGPLHRERRFLAADNGNVARIGRLIDGHQLTASELHHARAAEEAAGVAGDARYLRPGDLSAQLTARFAAFATTVRGASAASVDDADVRRVVADQQRLRPTYLIAMEDFTIATLTALGIEPEYSLLPPSFYSGLSERAIEFAVDTADQRYGPASGTVFAGLHAIDLDGAVRAGQLAAAADVGGIATGLVGALQDRTWVDYRVEDGRLVLFDRAVPRPYVRVLEIAAGLHLGYAEHQGRRCRFHALGAGTPIVQPLLALLGDRATFTSADSTAPIVDGWIAPTIALYVDDPAPLKYNAHRIAEAWLADDDGWRCGCPYCRGFVAINPNDIVSARAWWRAGGRPSLTPRHLAPSSPLSDWLPLLGRPADPQLRRDAGLARVGHNHWVLQRIERNLHRHSATTSELRDHVAGLLDAYQHSAAGPAWKAAAAIAWGIADRAAASLADAAPQPLEHPRMPG